MRLSHHNQDAAPVPFATISASETEFTLRGLSFRLDTVETPSPRVEIHWADTSTTLPITGRDNPALPGLMRHMDWLRVMMIVDGVTSLDGITERIRAGEIPSRFLVVVRSVAPGLDPDSWGAAKYKDYVYTYLELETDGTITRSERTYREIALDTRSWRHVAAMHVTGGLNTPSSRGTSPISYPNYAGVKQAMDAMGWTWPVFGVGAFGFLAGLILLMGSFVKSPDAPAV